MRHQKEGKRQLPNNDNEDEDDDEKTGDDSSSRCSLLKWCEEQMERKFKTHVLMQITGSTYWMSIVSGARDSPDNEEKDGKSQTIARV